MNIDQAKIKRIYTNLLDDISRRTFLARLNFSCCPCDDTLADLVATLAPHFVAEVKTHIAAGRKIAVYGAGTNPWYSGRMVYQMFERHACGLFDKNADTLEDIR